MLRYLKKGGLLIRDCTRFILKGRSDGLTFVYLKCLLNKLFAHLHQFQNTLNQHPFLGSIDNEEILKLKNTAKGLHALLPADKRYSYSLLIPLLPKLNDAVKSRLKSCFDLSSSNLEILISTKKEYFNELSLWLSSLSIKTPISVYTVDENKNPSICLIEKAKNHFFLILESQAWVRPDILLRYEQTLRLLPNPENTILYCNKNRISAGGYFYPFSEENAPSFDFPYFFEPVNPGGMLVPRKLYYEAGGIPSSDIEMEYAFLEFLLSCYLKKASFCHVPIPLYSKGQEKGPFKKCPKTLTDIASRFIKKSKAPWECSYDLDLCSLKIAPPLQKDHLHIIIPFRDQKELTIKCVKSLLKQNGVPFSITAVDNGSKDPSIAANLKKLGCEVLTLTEPFNYSRLNNFAVENSAIGKKASFLLFLNNDVELKEGSLLEMMRWIGEPEIGMVGCRLHYPDGRLQHGGILVRKIEKKLSWDHREKLLSMQHVYQSKRMGFVDAVTAACALIKKDLFISVGGFDEMWYPIAYSDTYLASKIQKLGKKVFYTPFAEGIHHESISRKSGIEDFEASEWLYKNIFKTDDDIPHKIQSNIRFY